MSRFNLITSNRLEILADRLAEKIRAEPLPPLEPEIIVVQSKGIQHWLNLEIAERNKISGNCAYPFPTSFIYQTFANLLDLPEEPIYAPNILRWKIFPLLESFLEQREFSTLNSYIGEDKSGLRRYQLSGRLADLFDQYLIYRPDIILEWDKGHNPLEKKHVDSNWQFLLWRAVTSENELPSDHPAALKERFLKLNSEQTSLPCRISVFGISYLPPYHLDFLFELSRRVEVDFYYLNPCKEFWEYCYSEKEVIHFLQSEFTEEDQYYEEGNRLLASMGTAAREFFSLLLHFKDTTEDKIFIDPGEDTLLHSIQSDILNLRQKDQLNQCEIDKADRSIQIHCCYSPMREVEVLYDSLLELFDENPDLQPRDVVVMMPDVSKYAPLVQAVFETPEEEQRFIPYSISDASMEYANGIAEALLKILNLDQHRFKISEVMGILDSKAVRDQFEIAENELDSLKILVRETGIRWGIDGAYRSELNLPNFEENTIQFGIQRALLGVALSPEEDDELFQEILPYSVLEGDQITILGRFIKFIKLLISVSKRLKTTKSASDWNSFLSMIINSFFQPDEDTEDQLQEVRSIVLEKGLFHDTQLADFHSQLSAEVVIADLDSRFRRSSKSTGFMSHGVTFCTMLPMRSIPFKVICLLGMNDGDYPRIEPGSGFNLIPKTKRLCDRSKRNEDKLLFLEAICSAREKLWISYTGSSIKDGSDLPPSVLVSELCDSIDSDFRFTSGEKPTEALTTRHPLQPFHELYYRKNSSFFSYSHLNQRAALENRRSEKSPRSFLSNPLPEIISEPWVELPIDQLCRFFKNPAEFLIRNRLNIFLQTDERSDLEDREPLQLDALQQYFLKEKILSQTESNLEPQRQEMHFRASGDLPVGNPGTYTHGQLLLSMEPLKKVLSKIDISGGESASEVLLEFESPAVTLHGVLRNLYPAGQLFYRSASIKTNDLLNSWIYHLVFCASHLNDFPQTTYCVGSDQVAIFSPVVTGNAKELLQKMIVLFLEGQRTPLPFFPESSIAFSNSFRTTEGNAEIAIIAASKKWETTAWYRGESENPYFNLCFGAKLPADSDFGKLSNQIFDPLLSILEYKKHDEILSTS